MIKILLADDHSIVRNGIRNLLEKEENIEIVGEARNAFEVLKQLQSVTPHIILADMNMAGMSGTELAQKLNSDNISIKVILLTMHDNQLYVNSAFRAGVQGYLFKNIDASELLFAINQVHSGRRYLSAELSMRMLDQFINQNPEASVSTGDVEFSSRELAILKLIAEGHTNQEIADMLFTSKRTVEGHRQSMINQSGVRNTAALIRFAMQHGLL